MAIAKNADRLIHTATTRPLAMTMARAEGRQGVGNGVAAMVIMTPRQQHSSKTQTDNGTTDQQATPLHQHERVG